MRMEREGSQSMAIDLDYSSVYIELNKLYRLILLSVSASARHRLLGLEYEYARAKFPRPANYNNAI
jgi:hypothetical protein